MRVFVTGASGWIGSALVAELVAAGHRVVGLARSEPSAAAVIAAGGAVRRGSLDDLDGLRRGAAAAEGVVHLAFKHDSAFSGDFAGAAATDRRAVEAFGEVLAGSDRPLVVASGTLGVARGRVATETDGHKADEGSADWGAGPRARHLTAEFTRALAGQGVRSSVVRLPPTCHGEGDHGLLAALVAIARDKGVSGYIGDGSNRWPAVHRLDAAHLFRLALDKAAPGSTLHAVADEGVPIRDVAGVIARHLDVPAAPIAPADARAHFGFLADFLGEDGPASSALTKAMVGWQPRRPGLIDDLQQGHYFRRDAAGGDRGLTDRRSRP